MVAVLFPLLVFPQDKEELVRKSLPLLNDKIRSLDQNIYPAFLKYAASVLKPDWINTDDDLKSLFEERESLLKELSGSGPLRELLTKAVAQSEDWEEYVRELGLIGIRAIGAEGEVVGFAEAPVLEVLINLVASEPYRLYIQLVDAYAKSRGSEYTYMDLGPEMKAIEIAERLIAQSPDSKYAEPAKKILGEALFPLTDWHVILPDDPTIVQKSGYRPYCIVGELRTNAFPCWTVIGEPIRFLEGYPASKFHDIVDRIIKEPSEIMKAKSVYVVVVDEFNDEELARKAILNYLLKGIDIPHLITLSETSYVVAYRFFADPEKAKRALEKIKTTKPNATIRELYPHDY
jgi:hypothetical protein